MGLLFLLYVGFTLYLYFAREPIRTDVNFLMARWYDRLRDTFRQIRGRGYSRNSNRQRLRDWYDDY